MKYKAQLLVHATIEAESIDDAHEQANELKQKLMTAIRDAGLIQKLFWVGLDQIVKVAPRKDN